MKQCDGLEKGSNCWKGKCRPPSALSDVEQTHFYDETFKDKGVHFENETLFLCDETNNAPERYCENALGC